MNPAMQKQQHSRGTGLTLALCGAALALAAGCASTGATVQGKTPAPMASTPDPQAAPQAAPKPAPNPKDPFETFNRAMFGFNEGLDQVVIRPLAKGYDFIMPTVARTGVSNFFANVDDIWVSINNLLQGKPVEAASDLGRVLVNTTLGVGGLIDWASDMGLEKHDEDFGQTLARWGVGDGAFVVLPVIGPRTVRDGVGWGVDSFVDPVYRIDNLPTRNGAAALRLVENRAQLLPLDKTLEAAALDKYSYVRDAYLQRRRNLIYDGYPPRLLEDDFSAAPGCTTTTAAHSLTELQSHTSAASAPLALATLAPGIAQGSPEWAQLPAPRAAP